MRPSELPTHKQSEARSERRNWWARNFNTIISWFFGIATFLIIMALDFMGVI